MLAPADAIAGTVPPRDRSRIPDRYKWDLTDIYPTDAAWRGAKAALVARLPAMRPFQGQLASGATRLADALELSTQLSKELSRAYVYASMKSDEDTRDSTYQGMHQEMVQLAAQLGAETAYLEPEILRIDPPTIAGFLSEEPRLHPYKVYLQDIQRRQAHTGTDGEERLLASAAVLANGPGTIYGILSDADFPYPTITLADGTPVRLDSASYSIHRASPVREDRALAMSTFFAALGQYRATFGAMLSAQIQSDVFYARARNYDSALAAALDAPNIPVSVYTRLIAGVNRHLPTFHRYLKQRQRMLNVPHLHYYDLYAPVVPSVDLTYTAEEAQRHVLESLTPLGSEYGAGVRRAFSERWIDLFPNDGKHAGAYSNGGAYDVHPYILQNYNGKYHDVSTLTHELGHTMHSFFSNKRQPFVTAGYTIFVAEVASTFNEALLIENLLRTMTEPAARLSLLGSYLENIKGTIFRQTQFAEFELATHEAIEQGRPLTGDALDALYVGITRQYYGHDSGVCIVDDYIAHEWAFIPHFYRNFYVFQYATSYTASAALSEKVQGGDPAATARFLAFLGAGCSKYPIELLQDAGVDMTTDEPLDLTIQKMNRVMDEIDKLLD
ncbi:MAG: oligoendopeptidase F [Vicinamibacterales bacterium]